MTNYAPNARVCCCSPRDGKITHRKDGIRIKTCCGRRIDGHRTAEDKPDPRKTDD